MRTSSVPARCIGAGFGIGTAARAQSVGSRLATPLVAGGNLLSGAAGAGVTGSGNDVQNNGLRVGATSSGTPAVSVRATQPANQGTVAALLNGRR